ncbi:MAG: AbrB/MazE/SpoVT family DNA-binding domain-containing protein [Clostridiales bacterium]|nr:AbrB/MazE/SpoVT family DNA-binding domain-containing protein [Clostridiales bacterium]
MKTNIIRIGNSKGIRIPSFILKECKFSDEVELRVYKGSIVLSPIKTARQGWNAIYKSMHEERDDDLLFNDAIDIDSEDWEW